MDAINLVDLCKQYGNRKAVEMLNLTVAPGEIYGFIGPNGSGKTTTIRILTGILRPTSGEAFVNGFSTQKAPDEVRRLIGYMPDVFGVYPDLKVWEYLDFFGACHQIEEPRRAKLIRELLELVDLGNRRDDPVNLLSQGLKQRLSLARTLIHDPEVLLLDEPASGLDPRARVEIRTLLLELSRMGKTIFFSSHILSDVAEICTSVGIIESGALVASGSVDELKLQLAITRRINVLVLGDPSTAQTLLENHPAVRSVENQQMEDQNGRNRLVFELEGDDLLLSQILRELISSGVAVIQFSEDGLDLEEVFMRTTGGSL